MQQIAASEKPTGDMGWAMGLTGWSHDKISRLCRRGVIPGAFQAEPGVKGSMWTFRKTEFLNWFNDLGKPVKPRRAYRQKAAS
jgi:hypothetical protein